ncbi:FAD-dependent oxidoreductase [Nonomuraea sp. NPDC048892]|uniref:FAD-dependent oxidoreductase n=1 Tax=Nonomuraea sp. NPDC048892 TaxID=3154624 RepID=UPI0033FF5897
MSPSSESAPWAPWPCGGCPSAASPPSDSTPTRPATTAARPAASHGSSAPPTRRGPRTCHCCARPATCGRSWNAAAAAAAAEQAGARIARYTPVTEVREDEAGVTVVTAEGERRFTHAVVAPGPWARTLLPHEPIVAKAITSTWFPHRDESLFDPGRCPIAIRVGEPAYSCFPSVDGAGVKVNLHVPWREIGSPESLARSVPAAYVRQVARAVAATLPGLRPDPVRVATYADAFTPDGHGLLGRRGRTVVAAAFSGHGFKLAPVFGDIVADLVESGATARGIGHLAPDRPLRRSP